jgi:glutathione S-transferase
VPAFKDGDLLLTESGAMVTYLADKYSGQSAALGTPTPESRAVLARWVAFSNSTLCADLAAKNSRSLDVLESMLGDGRHFLLGDFSLADVCIAIYLGWMRYFVKCDPGFTISRWPLLQAYKDRVLARPSAKVVDMTWIEDESQWLL